AFVFIGFDWVNEPNYSTNRGYSLALDSVSSGENTCHAGVPGPTGSVSVLGLGGRPEGGIAQGKAQAVEPAIVTTYLKAYPNGDIEHKTEFLDNDTGRIASRMYANKVRRL
ncbi:hypothetical protein B7G60_14605, partial [Staphylococcus aureus]|uniref:hypothetical protein n=1 Tax=Staphylococcus aureus TaxID=1280 RepID=UPI000A2EA028